MQQQEQALWGRRPQPTIQPPPLPDEWLDGYRYGLRAKDELLQAMLKQGRAKGRREGRQEMLLWLVLAVIASVLVRWLPGSVLLGQ